MQQELNQGDECCNDDDIARQLDLFRNDFPQQADNQVGEKIKTKAVESPMPMPLNAPVVTAKVGHIPSRENQGRIFPNQSFVNSFP